MNHDDDTCPHLVVLGRLEAENVRLKADNAFLKAEVERLTAFTTRTIIPNEELQAQVERLTKPAIIGGYNLSQYIRMANSETLEFDNGDMFADMTLPERIKYIVESHARLKAEVERLEEIVGSDAIDRKYGMCCDASDEVARLKAEVERLTAFTTRTIIPNEELQAQVERLTKELENTDCMFAMASAFARDWQAAKEGKQP